VGVVVGLGAVVGRVDVVAEIGVFVGAGVVTGNGAVGGVGDTDVLAGGGAETVDVVGSGLRLSATSPFVVHAAATPTIANAASSLASRQCVPDVLWGKVIPRTY
jgi:hypothetical protein